MDLRVEFCHHAEELLCDEVGCSGIQGAEKHPGKCTIYVELIGVTAVAKLHIFHHCLSYVPFRNPTMHATPKLPSRLEGSP